MKFFSSLAFTTLILFHIPTFAFRDTPWLVEDAVDFLETFFEEKPNARVLEFGSGASTIWTSKRTERLHSIEHHHVWYAKVSSKLERDPECHSVDYKLMKLPYYCVCDEFPDAYFDLILVDGRNRKGCIARSIRILKPGGILMLDNSERPYYHQAFTLLKGWPCRTMRQTHPDKHGFTYDGWTTTWWIKPQNIES